MKYTVSIKFYDGSNMENPKWTWSVSETGSHSDGAVLGFASSVEKAQDYANEWIQCEALKQEMHKLDQTYDVEI